MKNNTKCHVDRAIKIIGGKWKLVILWYLSRSTMRFSELEKSIDGITQKMLTQSLRDLEHDGLVLRKVYPQIPPKVEYSITPRAVSLSKILKELDQWGQSQNII